MPLRSAKTGQSCSSKPRDWNVGTLTNTNGGDTRYWEKNPNDRLQEEYDKIVQEEEDRRNNSYRFDRQIGINMMIVNDQVDRKITLSADYAYNNGKAGEVVPPKALFGQPAEVRKDEAPRQAFARWVASKENPRFALTIANRLWKQTFGIGQIEPVDDMMDSTVAENPELMTFLESEMKRLNFDMKEYLRILYSTQAYQRQACFEEISPGAPYHFAGPVLRRMTAEQVWDSILTLAVPDEYRELPAEIVHSPTGRPFNVAHDGKVLSKLLSRHSAQSVRQISLPRHLSTSVTTFNADACGGVGLPRLKTSAKVIGFTLTAILNMI